MITVLQIASYDPSGKISEEIYGYSCWEKIKDAVYLGTKSPEELEESIMSQRTDVVLAAADEHDFTRIDFIRKLLANYPDIFVVVIGNSDSCHFVRNIFLLGAFDYLLTDELEKELGKTIMRMSRTQRSAYFSGKIYDKVLALARHIFDGGSNVGELVKDIVDTIYSDWNDNTIACQQVIEHVKQESYKHFVRKKPWLEKFIYRGDYIRDIGFELKSKGEIEEELCRYYSEVNQLFTKYNVIDVNRTIYTIGKSVIWQVDSKVTLDSVARDVYLNKTYISHIFKEMAGISFNDFVTEVKTDRAKMLLHYPDMNVSMIADMLCFGSSGYFSAIFKKHTGFTPTQYRELIKK